MRNCRISRWLRYFVKPDTPSILIYPAFSGEFGTQLAIYVVKPIKHKGMNTQDTIITLFNNLSKDEQVETLTTLYFSMRAEQKDEFLHETEND